MIGLITYIILRTGSITFLLSTWRSLRNKLLYQRIIE